MQTDRLLDSTAVTAPTITPASDGASRGANMSPEPTRARAAASGARNRLLIVSNRLPITVAEENGELGFHESMGGLVSGLSAYLESLKGSSFAKSDYVWIGWPGISVDEDKRDLLKEGASEFHAYPVFLTEEAMDKFYLGFCNSTVWPLFHYFPPYALFDRSYWQQYREVNQVYCDAIMQVLRPGDVVWVHDYHLMLLPKMLRQRSPDVPIGFFLHIPFPSFEIFCLLPAQWRAEILEGMLGADLVGFHTQDYTENFLRCALRVLGYEHNVGQMLVDGRLKRVETFPMGIDFDKFNRAARSSETNKLRNELAKTIRDSKVVLSIDRLDYTKGVINRLSGYELFLEQNPDWHGKVVLSMVVVPSRIGVDHYQQTKRSIDELVGKINGRFATVTWTPILYQYRFLPSAPLSALYTLSDVALVTPLRDGMNLVAKEYVASRPDQTGVLILSETAGAAKELAEAITIAPGYIEDIAAAIKEALEMPREEQTRRIRIMQTRLERYNVVRWAEDFIETLLSLQGAQAKFDFHYLLSDARERLVADFARARRRLLLLDYDGTLTPFVSVPTNARPSKELLQLLAQLIAPATDVVVISGRDRETVESWLGRLDLNLVAEHGAWLKPLGADWEMLKPLKNDWKPDLLPILEMYADRLPGSLVEEKQFSIVWHYRKADPELGAARARELVDDLVQFTANIDVQVLPGSKVVEVRNAGVDKGAASLRWLANPEYEFILAAGDDVTDEDLFKALPAPAYSIKVGMSRSYARFNLHGPAQLLDLLKELSNTLLRS
ncbi:MAG: bifunctional alpha,alpha-trehalose-phosphate synthase (UDP-forming)/trehalose-phosphatase [Chloroflexi bacterium]|nr:bifunctional alpha,alpha-trehalose-phosphate synthase (UDP-forming)/trehalose-phosphatase [Chloroflexota bacterium]